MAQSARAATAAGRPTARVYAGLQLRIVAFILDAMVLISFGMLFAFIPLYHILLWSWRGQTVGMMAVHVQVLAGNGGRVGRRRAAVRFFGRVASVLPLFLGLLMALFDRKHRTLHDRLAGTVVVEQP